MATNEGLVLDSLDLNGSTWGLEAFDAPTPAKRMEWAQGADADGANLVRDPLFENRTINLRLRLAPQVDMDTALATLLTLSKKLEECEQQPDGLALVWTPATATKSITFYVLSGTMDVPVTLAGDDAGWFAKSPAVNVTLTAKPFGYGTTVTGTPVTGAGQIVTLTAASVAGDVPAEGRLIVTDNATQDRRYLEWGLEQRYYNSSTALQIAPTVSGFGGTSTTRTGSVNTNVARGTLYGTPIAIAGTGAQAHVGTYRVKARVYASAEGALVRLTWQDADGPFKANAFAAPPTVGNWSEVDLGVITINPASIGTQRWLGRLEAYSSPTATTIDVDYLLLIPAGEGYGVAKANLSSISALSMTAYDEFAAIAEGALLGSRTAPSGGAWATSGATTDFAGHAAAESVTRSTSVAEGGAGRIAVLGTATYTDVEVLSTIYATQWASGSSQAIMAVFARYVDSTNWLRLVIRGGAGISLEKMVVGAQTTVEFKAATILPGVGYKLRLVAHANGMVEGYLLNTSDVVVTAIQAKVAECVTGGALQTGKVGIMDQITGAFTSYRDFKDIYVSSSLNAPPIVIYSGRSAEVRHDSAIRQDSTGAYYGNVPSYRGSRLLVPPAGDKNRTSRIAVKAHRNNIDLSDAVDVTDSLTAQLNYTPRYLVVPG